MQGRLLPEPDFFSWLTVGRIPTQLSHDQVVDATAGKVTLSFRHDMCAICTYSENHVGMKSGVLNVIIPPSSEKEAPKQKSLNT